MSLLPALVLALLAISIVRNSVWHHEGKLWADTIAKSPRKFRAYNERGLHLLDSGRPDAALGDLKRSLELSPYQPQVYVNIGIALERLGRTTEAIRAYEQAAWIHPQDPTAYYNLGVLFYTTLKDRTRALGYFLQALERDPREPDVHEYLGRIYYEMGDPARSNEMMKRYRSLK